jgi:tetratricopeptide (TPR) repeat protein
MIRLVPALLLFPALAFADFAEDFQKTRGTKDHAAMVDFLDAAAKSEADNPDYYALASNYWWSFAGEINLSTKPAAKGEPSIRDKDSGEEVGSISTNGDLDPSLRKKAVDLTGTGFAKFPRRLDIGLGHAHVRFKTGDAKGAVATLRQILKLAATPGTEFLWTGNAALPGPVDELLPKAIQGYTAPLFQAETDESDALCKELLDATVATFPDHPYAYNLLAALADAKGDKDGSYRFLKLAAEKAPEDRLILSNLADAHRDRGKKAEAIAAYEKIIGLDPDGEAAAVAKEALRLLRDDKDKGE